MTDFDAATYADIYEDHLAAVTGETLRAIAEQVDEFVRDAEGDPSVGIPTDFDGGSAWVIVARLIRDEADRRDREAAETAARIAAIPMTEDPWAVSDATTVEPF